MDITDRHGIQKQILRRLGYDEPQPFSTLQGDTPSNKLSFHLNKLQESGLIEKTAAGYQLTAQGVEAAPYLETGASDAPVVKAALFLTSNGTVYLEREEDSHRLDPTAAYLSPPSTRVHTGADLQAHAQALYSDRFETEEDEIELQAVVEQAVRFPNGAEQNYLLFHLGTERDQSGDAWYSPDAMGESSVLPGLPWFTEQIRATSGVAHCTWELRYSDGGVELDQVDVLRP